MISSTNHYTSFSQNIKNRRFSRRYTGNYNDKTQKNKDNSLWIILILVDRGGFEPPKSVTTDLQSVPFGRSGTCPYIGAGDWNRTHNLLITSQLLCQLSYTSKFLKKWCLRAESNHRQRDFQSLALPTELPRHIFLPLNFFKGKIWRPGWGSNPRPLAWQASVLTSWTTRPF